MHDAKENLDGWRLPAAELEGAVLAPMLDLLRDRRRLIDTLQVTDQRPASLIRLQQRAETIIADLDGRQPIELTAETLRRLPALPTDWDAQRRLLGFSG